MPNPPEHFIPAFITLLVVALWAVYHVVKGI